MSTERETDYNEKCIKCKEYLRKKVVRKNSSKKWEADNLTTLIKKDVSIGGTLCSKCRIFAVRYLKSLINPPVSTYESTPSLKYSCTSQTGIKCNVPSNLKNESSLQIPTES